MTVHGHAIYNILSPGVAWRGWLCVCVLVPRAGGRATYRAAVDVKTAGIRW
jgi:hypothetical protein